MSPQKQFRELQRKLDELGFITMILRVIANKHYDVIINGEIKKNLQTQTERKIIHH